MREQLPKVKAEWVGRTLSTTLGGVTFHGEVRDVIWHPLEKCFKAKCKFYNENSYFYKRIEGDTQ